MSDWPVDLSTGCFYQKSIFDRLEPILTGSFSVIEVCSSPGHLDNHAFASVCARQFPRRTAWRRDGRLHPSVVTKNAKQCANTAEPFARCGASCSLTFDPRNQTRAHP